MPTIHGTFPHLPTISGRTLTPLALQVGTAVRCSATCCCQSNRYIVSTYVWILQMNVDFKIYAILKKIHVTRKTKN